MGSQRFCARTNLASCAWINLISWKNMQTNNMTALQEKLADILKNSPQDVFNKIHQMPGVSGKISHLFLPGLMNGNDQSKDTIMVIGRETKGWGTDGGSMNYPSGNIDDVNLYVINQLEKSRKYLESELSHENNKGASFHNLLRNIKNLSKFNLVWANLFCYSWNKNRIDKSSVASEISILSKELLCAQISIIKPKIIILAHGTNDLSLKVRRQIFEHDKFISSSDYQLSHQIRNNQLWEFKYKWDASYEIQGFRIQHPSSISNPSRVARKFLIEKLNSF
jgi:hypothetical protein